MRHRKAGKKLGRTWEHRKAMFRSLVRSLLTHERIRTTEVKAKELRKVADQLITFGLENSLHARRKAYKVLENHVLVQKLFDEIAPRFTAGSGGYTRVVKLGLPRHGDAAPMAIIELTVAKPVQEKSSGETPKEESPAEEKKSKSAKKTKAKVDKVDQPKTVGRKKSLKKADASPEAEQTEASV